MKVLISGREGQLVQSLLARGGSVPGLELRAAGRPELDLENPASIIEVVEREAPDVIVNAAAYTAVDQAEDEPERAFRINGAAAGELAAAARRAGSRFIQISTDYVFDGQSQQPYTEAAATNPLGVYGASKLEGEQMVRQENPDHVIVRTAWVYSPFGKNFVRTMMALAGQRSEVAVVADQRGNPSSALDLADGILAILDRWQKNPGRGLGETYHLAGTGTASWSEFASCIFAECSRVGLPAAAVRPLRTQDWPTKARRPQNSVLDCSRFQDAFGYRAPAWEKSVAEVVGALAQSKARD